MFCPSCGKPIEESDAFCRSCGKRAGSQTQPAQPKPQAPVEFHSDRVKRIQAAVATVVVIVVLGLIVVGGYQHEEHGASVNDKELSISKIKLVNISIDLYVSTYSSGYPPSLSVMREPPLLPGMKRKRESATAKAS